MRLLLTTAAYIALASNIVGIAAPVNYASAEERQAQPPTGLDAQRCTNMPEMRDGYNCLVGLLKRCKALSDTQKIRECRSATKTDALADDAEPTSRPLPRYNVRAFCAGVADHSGRSLAAYNSCIDAEQQSYDTLKKIWHRATDEAQRRCPNEGMPAGDHSYVMTEICISEDIANTQARTSGGPKQFRW